MQNTLFIMFCYFWFPLHAMANALPSYHELKVANDDAPAWDVGLHNWISKLSETSELKSLDRVGRLNLAADEFEKFFIEVYSYNKKFKDSNLDYDPYQKFSSLQAISSSHFLMPYIYEQILKYYAGNFKIRQSVEEKWLKMRKLSCPLKRLIVEKFDDENFILNDVQGTTHLLDFIQEADTEFRRQALGALLRRLSKKRSASYRPKLVELLAPFDKLKAENAWLYSEVEEQKNNQVVYSSKEIDSFVKKGACRQAKEKYVQLIEKNKVHLELAGAVKLADEIALCYRKFGRDTRIAFWQEMVAPLKKKFKDGGVASIYLKLAVIYWNEDKNEQAKQYASLATELANNENLKNIVAESIYLSARIHENELNYVIALELYDLLLTKHLEHDRKSEVLRSVVLINAGQKKWEKVIHYANDLVLFEDEKATDERSSTDLGFGLFWLGRAWYEQNQIEQAEIVWHRLVNEYYSTYYGALAHRMLEEVKQTLFTVTPQKIKEFDEKMIEQAFHGVQDDAIERIQRLFAFGLRKDAACEIRGLTIDGPNSQPKMYAKALLLYASGEWLEGVKLYLALPRSYRRHLPLGSERLIFPRRYESTVEEYAVRASLDPDLVLSLIRQESVFNPSALSPAGARGLMQLMKGTAYSEAKRLTKDYVEMSKKNKLIKLAKSSSNLFEADLNIILGVHYLKNLLARYDNTVVALAAYNAGPSVVHKWLKKYPTNDLVYFVELIPYRETRDYVKLIMRNYFYYKRWYRKPTADFPHMDALLNSLNIRRPHIQL